MSLNASFATIPVQRGVVRTVAGMETSDGAGVRLRRIIGSPQFDMLDPFLLLDAFRSDDPDDYIAGFPPHPHRGFETVTYLLHGNMRHRDSAGHEGVIRSGGVQWMTAGRGIEHSEMPEQEDGLLAGFQLWVNLPAAEKMAEPRYQEFEPEEIPLERHDDGTTIRVIAGTTAAGTEGAVRQIAARPLYLDVTLAAEGRFEQAIPHDHNAFIQMIAGEVAVEVGHEATVVPADTLGVLGEGESVTLRARGGGSRLLLVAGRPFHEPVARGGPFVMNSEAELRQAFIDYRKGKFGAIEPR